MLLREAKISEIGADITSWVVRHRNIFSREDLAELVSHNDYRESLFAIDALQSAGFIRYEPRAIDDDSLWPAFNSAIKYITSHEPRLVSLFESATENAVRQNMFTPGYDPLQAKQAAIEYGAEVAQLGETDISEVWFAGMAGWKALVDIRAWQKVNQ